MKYLNGKRLWVETTNKMTQDNRVRLDPKYIRMLKMKANLEGYNKLTDYTKDEADKLEKEISLKLTGTHIPLGGFINSGKKHEKKFDFGF